MLRSKIQTLVSLPKCLALTPFFILFHNNETNRNDPALTNGFTCLVWWQLFCLRLSGFPPCFWVVGFLSSLLLRLFRHCWSLWALAVLLIFPSAFPTCLSFALFLIGLTPAFFPPEFFFYPRNNSLFTVSGSSAAFLNVFSSSPHWYLLRFGWDKKRGWWTRLDGAFMGDKMKENKSLW